MRQTTLVAVMICLCIAADLGAKVIVRKNLAGSTPQYFYNDLLRLSHWENAGTFMSLGDDLPEALRFWAFTVVVALFVAGLIVFILVRPGLKPMQVIAGSLIAGGSLSNIIDRLLHDGRVLDFINIGITPLHLMIFNLADAAIACGAAMLLYSLLSRRIHQ